ncbi:MAG TPA: hypothetical protein VFO78_07485 [Candidatus Limnocylindrales bacterium]|nr:hypothetical protein [Candidatus Limnocylindrales bacterium]
MPATRARLAFTSSIAAGLGGGDAEADGGDVGLGLLVEEGLGLGVADGSAVVHATDATMNRIPPSRHADRRAVCDERGIRRSPAVKR